MSKKCCKALCAMSAQFDVKKWWCAALTPLKNVDVHALNSFVRALCRNARCARACEKLFASEHEKSDARACIRLCPWASFSLTGSRLYLRGSGGGSVPSVSKRFSCACIWKHTCSFSEWSIVGFGRVARVWGPGHLVSVQDGNLAHACQAV